MALVVHISVVGWGSTHFHHRPSSLANWSPTDLYAAKAVETGFPENRGCWSPRSPLPNEADTTIDCVALPRGSLPSLARDDSPSPRPALCPPWTDKWSED